MRAPVVISNDTGPMFTTVAVAVSVTTMLGLLREWFGDFYTTVAGIVYEIPT